MTASDTDEVLEPHSGQDGTKASVFRYEIGRGGTREDGTGRAFAVFKTASREFQSVPCHPLRFDSQIDSHADGLTVTTTDGSGRRPSLSYLKWLPADGQGRWKSNYETAALPLSYTRSL